jgi:hypothetical protein
MENPSSGDWEKLYQAAIKFQQLSPWMWMPDEDLFAVENPEGGEIGYCSILGSGGGEFGMGIFLGPKGYKWYLEIISQEQVSQDFEEQIMIPLLSFGLVSRREMQKADLDIIRSLGLKFRGAHAWPSFRSQKGGYLPWYLEKKEAHFLTVIIERALIISEKVRDGRLKLYERVDEDKILTCRYQANQWIEEWIVPEVSFQKPPDGDQPLSPIDEAELLLLRNSSGKPGGSWEMDIFILPSPVADDSGRPYFPLCFLVVDKKLGMIIAVKMIEPWANPAEKNAEIIQILRETRPLPRIIHVKSQKVREILEPVAYNLGINLRIGPLPLLEEAKTAIQERFSSGSSS